MGWKVVAACVVVWRVLTAMFLTETAFNPDEYWQGLEPAHRAVFGYGYETWEWRHGLRSFVHPGLFTIVYAPLKVIRLDHTVALVCWLFMDK